MRGNNTEEIMRSYLVLPALLLAVTFAPAQAGPTARVPDGGMLLAQAKPMQPDTDASKNSATKSGGTVGKASMGTRHSSMKSHKAKSKKTVKRSKKKSTRRS
jgi:hypothetical protein